MRVPFLRPSGWLTVVSFLFLICPSPALAAKLSDADAARQTLGSDWIHLSRRAGIIFSGTLLTSRGLPSNDPSLPANAALNSSFIELRFRIERPIAGVEPGKVLTIREWTGALSRQLPLHPGEHVLLFLYPPSRLGLTSPVGGGRGQIRLDSSGQNIAQLTASSPEEITTRSQPEQSRRALRPSTTSPSITVSQLERAIHAARGE
ncbi:MAG: hypothetical protein WCB53_10585 [Terriglobales bacterium]